MCFVKRAEHDVGALLEKSVLLRGEKPRPKDGAERPIAEVETARSELIVEMVLAIGSQLIVQEIVIGGDAITHRSSGVIPSAARDLGYGPRSLAALGTTIRAG